jgi:predicted peroxiredoxin
LNDLLEAYIEAGGKLFACGPCVKARQLDPEKDLIEGALVVNAGVLVREFTEAKSTLVY